MTTPPGPPWMTGTVDDIAARIRQDTRAPGQEYAIAVGMVDGIVLWGKPRQQIERIRMVLKALAIVTAEEESNGTA